MILLYTTVPAAILQFCLFPIIIIPWLYDSTTITKVQSPPKKNSKVQLLALTLRCWCSINHHLFLSKTCQKLREWLGFHESTPCRRWPGASGSVDFASAPRPAAEWWPSPGCDAAMRMGFHSGSLSMKNDENISMRLSLTLISALWSRETSCHWTGGGAVGSWAHNSSQLLPTLDWLG